MIWRKLLEIDLVGTRRLGLAERSGPLRRAAAIFAHSGDSWFWLIGLGIVWVAGSVFWKELAAVLAASILLTAVFVLLIKFMVRRPRPAGEWGAIYRRTDPHSFPSGHAARAALIATLCVGLAPPWLGWLLVVWAPLVILSRVAMGVHYLSDVIAGAALGLLAGLLLLRIFPL